MKSRKNADQLYFDPKRQITGAERAWVIEKLHDEKYMKLFQPEVYALLFFEMGVFPDYDDCVALVHQALQELRL